MAEAYIEEIPIYPASYYWFYHKECGSPAYKRVHLNSQANRWYCEKCGMVRKADTELRLVKELS